MWKYGNCCSIHSSRDMLDQVINCVCWRLLMFLEFSIITAHWLYKLFCCNEIVHYSFELCWKLQKEICQLHWCYKNLSLLFIVISSEGVDEMPDINCEVWLVLCTLRQSLLMSSFLLNINCSCMEIIKTDIFPQIWFVCFAILLNFPWLKCANLIIISLYVW